MAENVTGVLEDVVDNGKGKGSHIRVGGYKYGVYDPADAGLADLTTGDSVSFRYKETTKDTITYKNIIGRVTKMTSPVSAATSPAAPTKGNFGRVFPVPVTHGDRSIIRQNSVTNATHILTAILAQKPAAKSAGSWEDTVSQAESVAEAVTNVARILEAYSAGDADLAEVEAAIKEVA